MKRRSFMEWIGKSPLVTWLAKGLGYNTEVASGLTPLSAELGRALGSTSTAGKSITEDSVRSISTAWACQRLLSESNGQLPWGLYERDKDGNAQKVDSHPLAEVLESPNADMTSVEFRETATLALCQNGNAYSYIDRRSDGNVKALTPLRARDMQPMRKKGTNTRLALAEGAVFFRYNDGGAPQDFRREEIWHVKGFGSDGLVGLSPLAAARDAMGFAMAAADYGSLFFAQGAKPGGVVSVPLWLEPAQRELARTNLAELAGGLANMHTLQLLEGGMKLEPWGDMSLKDMDFVLSRKLSGQEICRYYLVPPHMVGDLDRATFSNIEHLSQEFVTRTLMPYLTRFEASLKKWLLKPEDRARYFLRYNLDGLLRADTAARAAFYSSALQNGYMNRNEVRAKENLNRVPGLDTYTVQTSMAPVDRLDEMVDAQIEGGAAAPAAAEDADSMKHLSIVLNQPSPPAASQPSIGFTLPESVVEKSRLQVDHPGVREIAARTAALAKSMQQRTAAIENTAAELTQRFESLEASTAQSIQNIDAAVRKGIDTIAKVAKMPRKPIYDPAGNVIGSVVVESLDELVGAEAPQ